MGTADGTVERLVLVAGDGAIGARYNLVLVAEGYRAEDADTFYGDALKITKAILAEPPFAAHKKALNIFRLDVWSKEAGADRGSTKAATYFDAAFDNVTTQLLRVDEELVAKTVQDAFVEDEHEGHAHKVVVVVNTSAYGGSGGLGAGVCVTARSHGASTLLHELGHLFSLLDEYDSPAAFPQPLGNPPAPPTPPLSTTPITSPNISFSAERANLPWANLVASATPLPTDGYGNAKTIGAYSVKDQGMTVYRSQWECCMRSVGLDPYCTVCAGHIESILKPIL